MINQQQSSHKLLKSVRTAVIFLRKSTNSMLLSISLAEILSALRKSLLILNSSVKSGQKSEALKSGATERLSEELAYIKYGNILHDNGRWDLLHTPLQLTTLKP